MRTIRNTSPQEINEMFSVSVSPPAECGNLVAGQQADVTICDSTSEYAIKCIELAVLCLLCAVLGSWMCLLLLLCIQCTASAALHVCNDNMAFCSSTSNLLVVVHCIHWNLPCKWIPVHLPWQWTKMQWNVQHVINYVLHSLTPIATYVRTSKTSSLSFTHEVCSTMLKSCQLLLSLGWEACVCSLKTAEYNTVAESCWWKSLQKATFWATYKNPYIKTYINIARVWDEMLCNHSGLWSCNYKLTVLKCQPCVWQIAWLQNKI